MATATLTFSLELQEDGPDDYVTRWTYPEVRLLDMDVIDDADREVELDSAQGVTVTLRVVVSPEDLGFMLGHEPYERQEFGSYGSALDAWMHAGEVIQPTVSDLLSAITELLPELSTDRREEDAWLAEQAAREAEYA